MSVSHAIVITEDDHGHYHEHEHDQNSPINEINDLEDSPQPSPFAKNNSGDEVKQDISLAHNNGGDEEEKDRAHITACCFTMFLIMGPIMLVAGITFMGVWYAQFVNGPKHLMFAAVQKWNQIGYTSFSSIGFELEFYIHDYYNCPQEVLQTKLPNTRYQMRGGEQPLDPYPKSHPLDHYKQWKFSLDLPHEIQNLTGLMSDKCMLAATVFLKGNQQSDFPIGRLSGQIYKTHHHLISSICDYNNNNTNNNNTIEQQLQQQCEEKCRIQYQGVVNWTENACIQMVQLQQMCIRVEKMKGEWQETYKLEREGSVGFGCYLQENGKFMERLKYVETNDTIDVTQDVSIEVLVRSNEDPFIYFEYFTGGSLNINDNYLVDVQIMVGIILFIVGAAVTTAWILVCCCCCRVCCATDKSSLMQDPIGMLYYKVAKKYNNYVVMKSMQNQSFIGAIKKQEPKAFQRITTKPIIPDSQEYVKQLLLEDQLSFGKPLNQPLPPHIAQYQSFGEPAHHPPPPSDD